MKRASLPSPGAEAAQQIPLPSQDSLWERFRDDTTTAAATRPILGAAAILAAWQFARLATHLFD